MVRENEFVLVLRLFDSILTRELFLQPKQIHEIKDFLLTARRKDAKCK